MPRFSVSIHAKDVLVPSDPGVHTSVSITAKDEEEAKALIRTLYGPSVTIKSVTKEEEEV